MKRSAIVSVVVLLFIVIVTPAVAATQSDMLVQGIAALHDKDPAQQVQGVGYLESVIHNAPTSPEAGTACYQLGRYYKADREKSLAFYKQAYGISGNDQADAGVMAAYTLNALGEKLDAASMFEEVGTTFPGKASEAWYRAGMCYLGESRGKVRSAALRAKAEGLFGKAATLGNLDAQLQLLGMRWEDCDNGKAKWDDVIPDLEAYTQNTKAPAYARARACLMIAEHSWDAGGQSDRVLAYTGKVLATEFKDCRQEQAWAMYVRACALEQLGSWDEALKLYDDILDRFTDQDNFGGNNVRAVALYCKADSLKKLGRNDESAAVMRLLRQQYPTSEYAQGGAN